MASSLSRKSLLIISVPLLLLVAFAICLGLLLSRSEATARQALNCYDTEQICQGIESSWSVAQFLQLMYLQSGDRATQQSIQDCSANVPALLDKLKNQLSVADPQESRQVDLLKKDFSRTPVLSASERSKNSLIELIDSAEKGCLLSEKLRKISEKEEQVHEVVLLEDSVLRQLIHQLMAAIMLFNFLLAALLSAFFATSVSGRLKVVVDNTQRLGQGLPLNPQVGGGDEISYLDSCFHKMALSLTEAARRLEAGERELSSVIAFMPVALMTTDEKGKIESANQAASDLSGYEPAALSLTDISCLIPGLEKRRFSLSSDRQESELPQMAEYRLLKADGVPSAVEVSMSRLTAENGHRLLVSVQDVSERHRLAQQRQDFLSMVSHDLRTPLTSVGLSLNMLAAGVYGQLPPEAVSEVTEEEENVRRLILLINDLLDLEKMDSGKLELCFEPTPMKEVIGSALSAVKSLAERRQITIAVPHTNAEIDADEERLSQVLTSLFFRAAMVSPSGSTVKISVVPGPDWLEVRVADLGPWIKDEERLTFFDRWAPQTAYADSRRAGLRLPICQAIIKAHGGEIGIQSERGGGSTFWFKIPVSQKVINSGGFGTAP